MRNTADALTADVITSAPAAVEATRSSTDNQEKVHVMLNNLEHLASASDSYPSPVFSVTRELALIYVHHPSAFAAAILEALYESAEASNDELEERPECDEMSTVSFGGEEGTEVLELDRMLKHRFGFLGSSGHGLCGSVKKCG